MAQTATLEQVLKRATDAWNSHNVQAMTEVYAPDGTLHDPINPEPVRGAEAIRRHYEDLLRSFPDFHLRLEDSIAQGDTIAAEWTVTATNTGPLALPNGATVPATNRKVTLRCANIMRVDSEGKVIEERAYYDTTAFVQQLGLMPGA
jgi:steroid delta-isomerase-like uncharacterized protein